MEYTKEVIQEIINKKAINDRYQKYYYSYSQELKQRGMIEYSEKIKRNGNRLEQCLDFWLWDCYPENKVLDLQRVNRCKNNRFCPNCRKLELARFIHYFSNVFKTHNLYRFYPYLLTLTIPNVSAENLKSSIDSLNKAFNKFYKIYSQPVGSGEHGYKYRYISFVGGLRVLEITHNEKNDTYHPHLHCLMFSEEYDKSLFNKCYQGEYSYKRNSFNYYSELDLQIQKLWYMCFNNIRVTKKNYNNLSNDEKYLADIREMDEKGIYEVLKYTFKDSDIHNRKVFKTILEALSKKRIRQGFGILYNIKGEDINDGDKQSLEEYLTENKKETAHQIIMHSPNDLLNTSYQEFKKISRFNADRFLKKLD